MAGADAGLEVGRALDRVEPQRGRLGEALRAYELAAVNPRPGWSAGLGTPLAGLRRAFEEHVEFTEGPDGLFDEMLHDDTIEVSSEIDQLRRDHIVVIAAMDRAGEALANPPSDDDHLRELMASVARLVGKHRRRGAQLLYDVYSVDTSAGD
jgi:hypothetical protein